MAVTRQYLRDNVAIVNRRLEASPAGRRYGPLTIEWAYGRPRVYRDGGAREVSPRLATGEMDTWLAGFEAALDALGL